MAMTTKPSTGTVGVKYPFSIAAGQVVTTDNQVEVIGSRVTFCLGTQVGERIMRPTWGINILEAAFELEGEMSQRTVTNAIHACFRAWFPDYEVRKIEFNPTESRDTLDVTVTYGQFGHALDTVIKVGTPVPGGSEIFKGEVVR